MVFFQCLLSINKERYVLVSNSMYNLHTFYLENIYLIFKRQNFIGFSYILIQNIGLYVKLYHMYKS